MPWQTPTMGEVRRLNRDAIAAALPGADATVPNSVLRVLSDANAGLAALVLQYVDWLSRQFLPDTAEHEWLDRHGAIWLGGRKAATFASGTVNLTGLAGTVIPTGTRLVSSASVEYETTADVTLGVGLGPTIAPITALVAGAAGNQIVGAGMSVSVAITGLDGAGAVVELNGGTNAESDDSLRERVLERIRKPPMGGSADDYVAWARALPGVTRAWCAPQEMGIGTVTVRVMMDELRADTGGYPNSDDLDAITAAMDIVRPVTVRDFFVLAPTPEPIDFTIDDLVSDTTATRGAIAASVDAMLKDRAAPAHSEAGVLQPAQTIYREWVSAAILAAAGVDHFDLVLADHPMPDAGKMAVLGTITYT